MVWKPFGSARLPQHMKDSDDRTEIACALMLGARFDKHHGNWCCFDDTDESQRDHTGTWNFKVNAARAYLSTKGVFFDRQGNPVDRSIMAFPVSGIRKGD